MTRKLTDEQVKAIIRLVSKGASAFVKIEVRKKLQIVIQTVDLANEPYTNWQVWMNSDTETEKFFETYDEAIAYAEHLLNQRYCWLPQNNGWIMSGEVYNFANNGANKVLELMHLAHASDWCEWEDDWYAREGRRFGIGMPTSEEWSKGIIILANSPIWDAVKGVE